MSPLLLNEGTSLMQQKINDLDRHAYIGKNIFGVLPYLPKHIGKRLFGKSVGQQWMNPVTSKGITYFPPFLCMIWRFPTKFLIVKIIKKIYIFVIAILCIDKTIMATFTKHFLISKHCLGNSTYIISL